MANVSMPTTLDRVAALAIVDAVLAVERLAPEARHERARKLDIDMWITDVGTRTPEVDTLIFECASSSSIRPYPAMARYLGGHAVVCSRHRAQCETAAIRLTDRVEHWVSERLWSLNRVPELVLHDDRHVENVDRLAMQLAAPLFERACTSGDEDTLTVEDLELLSMAAWLHDWGQVGCRVLNKVVRSPLHVRALHGILSQELLQHPHLAGLHRLDSPEAERVGVLCAHHQGWTSISREGAEQDATEGENSPLAIYQYYFNDEKPRTLKADTDKYGLDLFRTQVLAGLLRVADAADVGCHRAPDRAAHTAMLVWRADEQAADTVPGAKGVETLSRQLQRLAEGADAPQDDVLRRMDNRAVRSYVAYCEKLVDSPRHWRKHRNVLRVDFLSTTTAASVDMR